MNQCEITRRALLSSGKWAGLMSNFDVLSIPFMSMDEWSKDDHLEVIGWATTPAEHRREGPYIPEVIKDFLRLCRPTLWNGKKVENIEWANRGMEIRLGAPGSGKTEWLIRQCAEHGGYIVALDHKRAHTISQRALELELEIPFPLTAHEWRSEQYWPSGVKQLWFDDLDDIIRALSRGVIVSGFTATQGVYGVISYPWMPREEE